MFKANLEIQKKVKEILNDPDTVDWIATISSESAKINLKPVIIKCRSSKFTLKYV